MEVWTHGLHTHTALKHPDIHSVGPWFLRMAFTFLYSNFYLLSFHPLKGTTEWPKIQDKFGDFSPPKSPYRKQALLPCDVEGRGLHGARGNI